MSKIESRLGHIQNIKKSSFVNFKKVKGDNVIRIGCFGDSFTFGAEVNEIYDYPNILQSLLDKRGYENIEVINFGLKWAGFHQTFMMWKYVGREYNLDYILLGPLSFWFDRDSTFNHTFPESYITGDPRYLHARYILKNNNIELIDVLGETYAERILNYWRFIPPLRYLRYDYEAPVFMRAPIACLFPRKKIKHNPFYYKKDFKKEMHDIYKVLLSTMADNSPQIILGNYQPDIVTLGKRCDTNNLFASLLYQRHLFPYKTFANHNSPCGNRLLVQQMFDCLTNKKVSTLNILRTFDIDKGSMVSVPIDKRKLSEYEDIAIELNNVNIGRFYNLQYRTLWGGRIGEPNYDIFSHIESFLVVKDDHSSMLDRAFIPLNFEIDGNMSVTMRIKTKNEVRDYPLGNVQLLNPELNIGMIDLGSMHFNYFKEIIKVKKDNSFIKAAGPLYNDDSINILLNGTPILCAEVNTQNEDLKLIPVQNGQFVTIRADGAKFVDIQELNPTGTIYLSLYTNDGDEPIRIPFAKWVTTTKQVFLGAPRLYSLPHIPTESG